MNERTTGILSLSALFCSVAAVGIGVYQGFEPVNTNEANYLDRIEELERELAYLQGSPYQARSSSNSELEDGSGDGLPYPKSLDGASSNLESDVEEMRWAMTVRGFIPATERHVERARLDMFNKQLGAKAKLSALRVLRRAEQLDDDVVRESIASFHSTDDARVQEGILEMLDDVTTPEFAPTLLKVTAEHLSYRVRRQAIDAMSGFLPDPELEDWLRYVEKNDGARAVRDEATRTLRRLAEEGANR